MTAVWPATPCGPAGPGYGRSVPLLVVSFLLLLAAPALAQDTSPGGDPVIGFPVALLVLAVVATVYALVSRARRRRRDQH